LPPLSPTPCLDSSIRENCNIIQRNTCGFKRESRNLIFWYSYFLSVGLKKCFWVSLPDLRKRVVVEDRE
jgi:hypothetical protein